MEGIDPLVGKPNAVLTDCGYVNSKAIERLERDGYDLYMPVSAEGNDERRYDFRPRREKPPRTVTAPGMCEDYTTI